MKLLCNACGRTAPPGSWSVIDGTLRLACSGCEGVAELPPRVAFAKKELDAALAAVVQEGGPSAATARPMATTAAAAAVGPTAVVEAVVSEDWLDQGWARLGPSWSDFSAHQRLIGEAAARNDFAGLGNRYRSWLSDHPKDEMALKAREELVRRATAAMLTMLPSAERGIGLAEAKRIRNGLLLFFLVGVIAFGAWVLQQMGAWR